MDVDDGDPEPSSDLGDDLVVLADAGGLLDRIAERRAAGRHRVVGCRHDEHVARPDPIHGVVEDADDVVPVARRGHALDDVVHADEDRDEFGLQGIELRQLDLDQVAGREPVDPEVRDELEAWLPLDELVRPALAIVDGGADRVRVTEGHVAEAIGGRRSRSARGSSSAPAWGQRARNTPRAQARGRRPGLRRHRDGSSTRLRQPPERIDEDVLEPVAVDPDPDLRVRRPALPGDPDRQAVAHRPAARRAVAGVDLRRRTRRRRRGPGSARCATATASWTDIRGVPVPLALARRARSRPARRRSRPTRCPAPRSALQARRGRAGPGG